MSTRFLLTGGAGFIGSHIVKRLVGEGAVVRVVDNLSTGQIARLEDLRCSIEYVEADLADNLVSDEVVKDVDYVLHQAAIPSVQRSVCDPIGTNRANVTATLNLLESCRRARRCRQIRSHPTHFRNWRESTTVSCITVSMGWRRFACGTSMCSARGKIRIPSTPP